MVEPKDVKLSKTNWHYFLLASSINFVPSSWPIGPVVPDHIFPYYESMQEDCLHYKTNKVSREKVHGFLTIHKNHVTFSRISFVVYG